MRLNEDVEVRKSAEQAVIAYNLRPASSDPDPAALTSMVHPLLLMKRESHVSRTIALRDLESNPTNQRSDRLQSSSFTTTVLTTHAHLRFSDRELVLGLQ